MKQLGQEKLPIVSKKGRGPRFWMVADGDTEILSSEKFEVAFEEARLVLEKHGIVLKKFPHDRSLPDSK